MDAAPPVLSSRKRSSPRASRTHGSSHVPVGYWSAKRASQAVLILLSLDYVVSDACRLEVRCAAGLDPATGERIAGARQAVVAVVEPGFHKPGRSAGAASEGVTPWTLPEDVAPFFNFDPDGITYFDFGDALRALASAEGNVEDKTYVKLRNTGFAKLLRYLQEAMGAASEGRPGRWTRLGQGAGGPVAGRGGAPLTGGQGAVWGAVGTSV